MRNEREQVQSFELMEGGVDTGAVFCCHTGGRSTETLLGRQQVCGKAAFEVEKKGMMLAADCGNLLAG